MFIRLATDPFPYGKLGHFDTQCWAQISLLGQQKCFFQFRVNFASCLVSSVFSLSGDQCNKTIVPTYLNQS